jgi:hypothetical protein
MRKEFTYYTPSDREVTVSLPVVWVVCPECNGSGTELYGSLKGADVTEACREDYEFCEDYFSGAYDVPCSACKGRTTVLAIDEGALTVREQHHNILLKEYEYQRVRYEAECRAVAKAEGGYCY